MKRTTIFVPEALERDLQLYAAREGKSTAAVVREALAEYVANRRTPGALPSFAAAFASGHADTAERHEELLFKQLTPHSGTKDTRRRKVTPPQSRTARSRRRS
jgi:plasmid stability protein